ncbi:SDR family NAD(P)-dependent oxidoreductase [Nonomuraea sp. NPDC059007]|uniref:SDR family NAD(P)-dependent oxidoreductase n=1 Tax=Nonomuraea sp. NPDC059007 TaxID=3346692 RepID=UPI0036B53519
MFDLSGLRALVTGAGDGGLGAAAARALASRGADTAVLEHPASDERAQATAEAVRQYGVRGDVLTVDLTDSAAVATVLQKHLQDVDGIDILVNAAGIMLRKPSLKTSLQEWRQIQDVNVTASWLVSNLVAPGMLERGFGRIINVASQYAALAGPIPEPAYFTSKGAVANLTRALASEWSRHGVNVNCIAPGTFYPTHMTSALSKDPGRLGWMENRTMIGRLGDPSLDIAGPITFLASREASYVTGAVLPVDGGWTAW